MRIGIDFDNTIVGYGHIFAAEAKTRGLIPDDFAGDKTDIRDHIRNLKDGETEWQRLQGHVYGARMSDAYLIDGVGEFLTECQRQGHEIFIVSHKTRFAHHNPNRVDLRAMALTWMETHAFFDSGGYGLCRENVYFEPTRREKVARIGMLGCSHFIDDLIEVFQEDGFPNDVERYLFRPGANARKGPLKTFDSWQEISDDIFGHSG